MERPALCSICGKVAKPAYTCKLCGAIVCFDDMDHSRGICKRCAGGRMIMDH